MVERFIGIVKKDIMNDRDFDSIFLEELIKLAGDDILRCFQCGNCTSVCPVSINSTWKTRKVIELCLRGLSKYALLTPWVCATCYRCYERCPAEIDIPEIMIAIRKIAIRRGKIPKVKRRIAMDLAKYGQIEISESILELKKKPQISKPLDEKVVQEVRTIMRLTGFDKAMMFDLKEIEK